MLDRYMVICHAVLQYFQAANQNESEKPSNLCHTITISEVYLQIETQGASFIAFSKELEYPTFLSNPFCMLLWPLIFLQALA